MAVFFVLQHPCDTLLDKTCIIIADPVKLMFGCSERLFESSFGVLEHFQMLVFDFQEWANVVPLGQQ